MAQKSDGESIAQLAAQRELLREEAAKSAALADAASARYKAAKPAQPEEIFVKGDDRMTLDTAWFRPASFQFAVANGLRQTVAAEGWQAMLADPPRLFGSDKVNERALERIRSGLAAAERYEEAVRRADLEAGYSAAHEAFEAAHDRLWALDERIVEMKAACFEDVVRQAGIVRAHCESGLPDGMIEALLTSIEALGIADVGALPGSSAP
ncbi:MAG: hypothetical protein AB7J30_01585 [Hyphomicrobium sp.]|uniref:hypothetical protein n=1 Tax=Hyphomicrobium sp. TaxID=82 RepID=UPI003D0B11DB